MGVSISLKTFESTSLKPGSLHQFKELEVFCQFKDLGVFCQFKDLGVFCQFKDLGVFCQFKDMGVSVSIKTFFLCRPPGWASPSRSI